MNNINTDLRMLIAAKKGLARTPSSLAFIIVGE